MKTNFAHTVQHHDKPLHLLIWSVLAFLIAGCATAPPSKVEQMPVKIPQDWTADMGAGETIENATPKQDTEGWLVDFDDPKLKQLVEQAQAHNYDLQVTAARLSMSAADAVIAGADRYPQLSASFDASRQKVNFDAQGLGFPPSTFDDFDLTPLLSWELDIWGRLRDRQSAAIGDLQAAAAELHGARLSLAARTAIAWFMNIEAQLQVTLAEDTWESFERATTIIQGRFERGLSPALDLRLSKAQTEAAQATLAAQRQALDAATRDLQIMLGQYPSADLTAASDLPQINKPVPVGLPSELLQRRPDLIAAERRLAAADKRISEAKKAMLPSISLTGAYGTTSQQLENIVNHSFSVWTIAANLVQPIFQGRRIMAGIERAQAVAVELLAHYGQVALVAFGEVEKSLAAEQFLNRKVSSLQLSAAQSTKAEAAAWQRYQRGLTDIITVLESQRRTFQSRKEHITARRQRLVNRVHLYLALGGDFSSQPTRVVPSIETPLGEQSFPIHENS